MGNEIISTRFYRVMSLDKISFCMMHLTFLSFDCNEILVVAKQQLNTGPV